MKKIFPNFFSSVSGQDIVMMVVNNGNLMPQHINQKIVIFGILRKSSNFALKKII